MKRSIPLTAWVILMLFYSGLSNTGHSQVQVKGTKLESANQQRAVALLVTLQDRSKDIDDEEFKIRTQALIADALWKYNTERARRGFVEAFQAVSATKIPEPKCSTEFDSLLMSPKFRLRQELLQMIWKHDSALADSLRQSIDESKWQGAKSSGEQATQYMFIAANVAEENAERAAQMVAGSLKDGINPMTLLPLRKIGESNPSLANKIYAQTLSVAQTHPAEVMDNIQHLMFFVLPSEMDRFYGTITPTPERRAAIEMFLNFAYKALLQKVTLEVEVKNRLAKQSRAEEESFYLGETLALFDQYRPSQGTELRAKLASVMGQVPPIRPSGPGPAPQPGVDELLDQAKSQSTVVQKDRLYMQAAYRAANEGDIDRGLSIAKNVDNRADRLATESNIKWQALLKALKKDEFDVAYKYAKENEFVPQRVDAYQKIIQGWQEKKDTARANELVKEIEEWLGQTDVGADQAMGLLKIAGVAAGFDTQRGFEVMHSAVKALNNARFDLPQGIGGGTIRRVQYKLTSVDFRPVFPPLANTDFDRALVLAQSLEKKELAILAQVAVCQGVLIDLTAPTKDRR